MTKTPRSLQVRPDAIERVKAAYQRSGYSTQQSLAKELGLNPDTVNRYLNGKPVDRLNFFDLSETLELEVEAIALLYQGENVTPESSSDEAELPEGSSHTAQNEQNQVTQNVVFNQGKVIGSISVNGNVTL